MFVAPVLGSVGYQIQNSLRFNGTNSYLSRAAGTSTTTTTFTYSFWFKASEISSDNLIFAAGHFDGSNNSYLSLNAGQIFFPIVIAGVPYILTGTPLYRDPVGWYHLVVSVDTTQATAANRVTIEVNGVAIALTGTYPPQNQTYHLGNGGSSQYIGINQAGSAIHAWDGYLAEWQYVNGQKLAASNFGASDPVTWQWRPIKYAGTYGASGYYLDFKNGASTTTLGNDVSGNAINWTLSNFTRSAGVNDCWMTDTPTNNFATLNPITALAVGALSAGNLTLAAAAASWNTRNGTIAVSSGKWYWENTVVVGGNDVLVGINPASSNPVSGGYPGDAASGGYGYHSLGTKYNNGAGVAYGATYTTNDVIGVKLDLDAGTIEFFKNNVSQGVAYTGISGTFVIAASVYTSGVTVAVNAGQRSFAYTPPAGYKALCTANLQASKTVIQSGAFSGNANADGPFVWCNGTPETLTIDGNAVTWGTHADRLSNGFKIRTAASPYNDAATNNWTCTVLSPEAKSAFINQNAKGN